MYGFCENDAVQYVDTVGTEVVVINHMLLAPPGGWTSPRSVAETVFSVQKHQVTSFRSVNGKLNFSVEIVPDTLLVHIYYRSIQSGQRKKDGWMAAIARIKEQDHVAIARKLDHAFHEFKYVVELIDDCPSRARKEEKKYEKALNEKVKQLLKENKNLDRPGGPHDL